MGAWGSSIFDNDSALDVCDTIDAIIGIEMYPTLSNILYAKINLSKKEFDYYQSLLNLHKEAIKKKLKDFGMDNIEDAFIFIIYLKIFNIDISFLELKFSLEEIYTYMVNAATHYRNPQERIKELSCVKHLFGG